MSLVDPSRAATLLRAHPARIPLLMTLVVMRRTYGPLFAKLQWSGDVERVVCDMACALSPISVDPFIAFAIHALGSKPELPAQLGARLGLKGYGR